MTADFLLSELLSVADPDKALFLQRFFKTMPGQYAEGDVFLGIRVPIIREIAKTNRATPLEELGVLIQSPYHDARLCALLILLEHFKRSKDVVVKAYCFQFYLQHTAFINNWDLVDVTCPHIVGAWLMDKDREVLYRLAESTDLWEQRIAIVSTLAFVRKGQFHDTLELVKKLIAHPHDLIHKAMGWTLREVGKKDRLQLTAFLDDYATRLPRTTLRYAIEHYPEEERKAFLLRKA